MFASNFQFERGVAALIIIIREKQVVEELCQSSRNSYCMLICSKKKIPKAKISLAQKKEGKEKQTPHPPHTLNLSPENFAPCKEPPNLQHTCTRGGVVKLQAIPSPLLALSHYLMCKKKNCPTPPAGVNMQSSRSISLPPDS